jgi:hypothetical protein
VHLCKISDRVGESRGIEFPIVLIPIVVVDESVDGYLAVTKLLPLVLDICSIFVSPPAQ